MGPVRRGCYTRRSERDGQAPPAALENAGNCSKLSQASRGSKAVCRRPELRFDIPSGGAVEYSSVTATAKKIEQELRELPVEDLLALHEHLVVSINEKLETEQLDPAFRDEIWRRVEEIDSGKAEGVEAFEALKKM